MSPLLKKVFTLNKNDRIILSISLLVLLISSVGLYYDLNRTSGGGSGKQIGVLRIKNNIAQRKYTEQVIWENLKNEIPLYNNDSIRTGDLSGATIILNDKTEIDLDENSMIVLSVDEDAMSINFVSGSIQAKRQKGEGGDDSGPELTIKSKDKIINIDDSDIQLSKGDKEELVVDVKRGKASIKTSDGKKQEIKENERASLTESGKIEIKKVSLILQSPSNGTSLYTKSAKQPIQFSWKALENKQRLLIEASVKRNFSKPAFKRQVTGTSITSSLKSGIYYWRISAINKQTKKREYSEIRKVSIVQNSSLRLHSPAPSQKFEYVTDPPFVSFSWSKNELANNYKIELTKDPNFGSIANSRTVSTTGTSINLAEGTWYWRIKTNSSNAGANETSPVQKVIVKKLQKIAAPIPIGPTGGKSIPGAYFTKTGVTFNWKSSSEIRSNLIQISKNASFSNILVNKQSKSNFTKIQKNLATGTYYWRIIGTDKNNRKTEPSTAARFTVGTVAKIVLLNPTNNNTFDLGTTKQTGLAFNWKRTQTFGDYQIDISRNKQFSSQLKRFKISGLSHQTKALGKGKWYWRVSLLDGKTLLSTSETRTFEISDAFIAPFIVTPTPNAIIDLTNRNSLLFSWKKSSGAVLYNTTVEFNNTKLYKGQIKGTTWIINDFSKLKRGKFKFTVSACRKNGKPKCSKIRQNYFTITLKNPEIPSLDTNDEIFVIEE